MGALLERDSNVLLADPGYPFNRHFARFFEGCAKTIAVTVDNDYQLIAADIELHSDDDEAFVINSFSKFFGMTGWRLGWLVVPEGYSNVMDQLAQNLFLAAPTMSQYAALAAF